MTKYSNLRANVASLRQAFSWMPEEELNKVTLTYIKRWRKFYGMTSKYKGDGTLREDRTAI